MNAVFCRSSLAAVLLAAAAAAVAGCRTPTGRLHLPLVSRSAMSVAEKQAAAEARAYALAEAARDAAKAQQENEKRMLNAVRQAIRETRAEADAAADQRLQDVIREFARARQAAETASEQRLLLRLTQNAAEMKKELARRLDEERLDAAERRQAAVAAAVQSTRATLAAETARELAEAEAAARQRLLEAVKSARETGRREGADEARTAMEARRKDEERAAAQTAGRALELFSTLTKSTPLLGKMRLKEDKAKLLPADGLLEIVKQHLETMGYELVMLIPADARERVRTYGEAKVSLSLSPEFNVKFVDYFDRMTVFDGLALVCKLYGFDIWLARDRKQVWLGYAAGGHGPAAAAELPIHFDESTFTGTTTRIPTDIPSREDLEKMWKD